MWISPTVMATALLVASPALAADLRDFDSHRVVNNSVAGSADAVTAYTQMAKLDSKPPDARPARSPKAQTRIDLNQIIAYYNAAIKRDPNDDDAYFHRGIAKFFAGALPQARDDISQASKLDPKYPYYPLWIHIIDQRGNRGSSLAQAIAEIDMNKWPAPVIHMFLGETTPDAVLAAADDPDPTIKNGQVCEANFYSGEVALLKGARDEAARLFHLAAGACPHEFVEGPAANSELAALDAAE